MASADNEKEEVLVKVPPLLYPEEDTSSIDSVDLSSMDLTNKNSIDNDQENKTENLSSNNNIIDSIPSEIKIHEDKYIWYDDDSQPYYLYDDKSIITDAEMNENYSVSSSAENAFMYDEDVEEVYQLHEDEIGFNYRGPKVLPINETPVTICTANTIGTLRSRKLFRVLMDSGSTACWIKESALPNGVVPRLLDRDKQSNTLAGKLTANKMVVLRDLRLPEFDKNRRIDAQRALIFDNDDCKYDIILGTNFLSKTGIKLNYETGNME